MQYHVLNRGEIIATFLFKAHRDQWLEYLKERFAYNAENFSTQDDPFER